MGKTSGVTWNIFENFSTLPPICSAIATAASFPEFNIRPYTRFSSVTLSPSLKSVEFIVFALVDEPLVNGGKK